ncbi:MAG TPA: oligosaccharide flippase family protein [Phycisphaerae bacterium]|nr:oligosaccharide flippase family protein [Phycisphaerae bacterium]
MSTRHVILRNVASNWIGYLVGVVVALFISPFVVHTLGDSSYGIWTLVVSVTGYYGLFDLGIRSAVGQYVTRYWAQRDMDGVNRTMNTAFVALATVALPVAGTTVVLAVLLPRLFDIDPGYAPQAQGALLIIGLRVAAGLPLAIYGAVTTARQRFDISNAIGIVNSLVSAGLIVLLLPRYGILGLAVTTAIAAVMDWVAHVWVAHRLMPGLVFSPRRSSWMAIKEIGHYGVFAFIRRISDQVIYQTDAIVIGIFMPLGAITYYVIGANLLPYLGRIIGGMVLPLTPVATSADATGDREQLRRLFLVGTRGTFLVACFIGGGTIFLSHDFLRLWMGAKYVSGEVYTSSAVILTILAAAALVRMLQSCGLQILFGMRHVRFLALLSGCEAIANLGLSLMLVKPFGLVGVAVGTLVPQVLTQGIVQPVFLLRRLGIRWRTYLTQAPVGGLAVMASMGLVYALTGGYFAATDWVGFLIKGLVVSGPAVLVGILIGTTGQEKSALVRRVRTVLGGLRRPS